MLKTILSRYLNPEVLSHVTEQGLEPQGLVIGNLAGAHKSPLSGFAVEFAGHREYVSGDDPKHIDWRVYFTRDKYFVKQYELETNFVGHLILDVSASMRYGEGSEQKLMYAAQMAVTLAYSIVRQTDKVSFITFDDRPRAFIPPGNSLGQIMRMTHHLEEIEPVEKTNMVDSLQEIAGRLGRREIVMIFSDFFTDLDALEPVLQRFRFSQHEVILFHVMHHDEIHFEIDGMTKFLGLEIPEEILAQPEDIRAAYLKAVGSHREKMEIMAMRNRCEYVLCDTRRPLKELFLDYLNRRNLIRTR